MPLETCSCGAPMVVRRVLRGVVFGACIHCDGGCYRGMLCTACVRLHRAQVAQ